MGAVYKQLSITERRRIERWRHAKVPVDEMARVLKRCRSTIFRELKRNFFSDESMPKCDGYYGAAAHLMQADRRARDRKLIKHPELCKRVIERIKDGWSPEQIAGRMRLECHALCVSHETIYRYAYSKDGRAEAFYRHLPEHRKRRRPRGYRRYQRPNIQDAQSYSNRPAEIANRHSFGHWECDLMMFRRELERST
jgi:IS30 family transposase